MIKATCPGCGWEGYPRPLRQTAVVAQPLPGLLEDDRPRHQDITTVRCPQCRHIWRVVETGAAVERTA